MESSIRHQLYSHVVGTHTPRDQDPVLSHAVAADDKARIALRLAKGETK